MSKALITGASGFIGGHLAEALVRRDGQVRCGVRRTSEVGHLERLGAELVPVDLDQPEELAAAVADVEVVYHLAAKTSALRKSELLQVNGGGTGRLAAACAARRPPPVLIFVSSVAAAGPAPRGRLRTESDPPAPVSHYGRSKRAGEIAVEELAHQLPATVVRPGIVFGQRNRETFPIFAAIRRFRCHPVAGCRSPRLSLIHVEDLVEILLRCADRGARIDPSEIKSGRLGRGYYFACAPEFPTYGELGWMMAKPLGRRWMLPIPAPFPLPWLIAGGNQLASQLRRRSDSFNIDKIREARVASWACSPEAARRDLGFEPPKSLAERLSETARWYIEEGWL